MRAFVLLLCVTPSVAQVNYLGYAANIVKLVSGGVSIVCMFEDCDGSGPDDNPGERLPPVPGRLNCAQRLRLNAPSMIRGYIQGDCQGYRQYLDPPPVGTPLPYTGSVYNQLLNSKYGDTDGDDLCRNDPGLCCREGQYPGGTRNWTVRMSRANGRLFNDHGAPIGRPFGAGGSYTKIRNVQACPESVSKGCILGEKDASPVDPSYVASEAKANALLGEPYNRWCDGNYGFRERVCPRIERPLLNENGEKHDPDCDMPHSSHECHNGEGLDAVFSVWRDDDQGNWPGEVKPGNGMPTLVDGVTPHVNIGGLSLPRFNPMQWFIMATGPAEYIRVPYGGYGSGNPRSDGNYPRAQPDRLIPSHRPRHHWAAHCGGNFFNAGCGANDKGAYIQIKGTQYIPERDANFGCSNPNADMGTKLSCVHPRHEDAITFWSTVLGDTNNHVPDSSFPASPELNEIAPTYAYAELDGCPEDVERWWFYVYDPDNDGDEGRPMNPRHVLHLDTQRGRLDSTGAIITGSAGFSFVTDFTAVGAAQPNRPLPRTDPPTESPVLPAPDCASSAGSLWFYKTEERKTADVNGSREDLRDNCTWYDNTASRFFDNGGTGNAPLACTANEVAEYSIYPAANHPAFGSNPTTTTFNATTMCCSCNGGTRSGTFAPTVADHSPAPTVAPTPQGCYDRAHGHSAHGTIASCDDLYRFYTDGVNPSTNALWTTFCQETANDTTFCAVGDTTGHCDGNGFNARVDCCVCQSDNLAPGAGLDNSAGDQNPQTFPPSSSSPTGSPTACAEYVSLGFKLGTNYSSPHIAQHMNNLSPALVYKDVIDKVYRRLPGREISGRPVYEIQSQTESLIVTPVIYPSEDGWTVYSSHSHEASPLFESRFNNSDALPHCLEHEGAGLLHRWYDSNGAPWYYFLQTNALDYTPNATSCDTEMVLTVPDTGGIWAGPLRGIEGTYTMVPGLRILGNPVWQKDGVNSRDNWHIRAMTIGGDIRWVIDDNSSPDDGIGFGAAMNDLTTCPRSVDQNPSWSAFATDLRGGMIDATGESGAVVMLSLPGGTADDDEASGDTTFIVIGAIAGVALLAFGFVKRAQIAAMFRAPASNPLEFELREF